MTTSPNPKNPENLENLVLDIVAPDVDDEVAGDGRADVFRIVHFVRADDAHITGAEPIWLAGNCELHHAFANQHHLLTQVLMGRVVDLAGRDVALMRFDFEAGVRLRGEHAALCVLAVGGDRQLVEPEARGLHDWQLLDRIGSSRSGCLLGFDAHGFDGAGRKKRGQETSEVAARALHTFAPYLFPRWLRSFSFSQKLSKTSASAIRVCGTLIVIGLV